MQMGGGGGRGRFDYPDPEIRGCPVLPKEGRGGGVASRASPLDPPLDYSFESSKNDRHKSSLTGADQYLLPRTAFIKNGARLCVV